MEQKVEVCFVYVEEAGKWDVFVQGCTSEIEAKQAFNAAVITAQMATPTLEANKVEFHERGYKMIVGV